MKRRRKRHDSTGRTIGESKHVRLYRWMMRTDAWQALSLGARCLLIESLLHTNDRARALEECRLGASYARTPQDMATFQRLYQAAQTYHR